MMLWVKEELEKVGYHAIGIDHFAHETDSLYQARKNKAMRRNFQGYTDDQAHTILGFGLSSITAFEGAYVQNTTDAPKYRQAIDAGKFPISRRRILNDEDKKRRAVIEEIMCGYDTDVAEYPEARMKLEQLEKEGLVVMNDNHAKITPEGWPFARVATSCFDGYFGRRRVSIPEQSKIVFDHPFLGWGFRPFFLLGALYSALTLLIWGGFYAGHVTPPSFLLDPISWHAHEMIYGFTMAIIAGFLLTAVANWTGGASARQLHLGAL